LSLLKLSLQRKVMILIVSMICLILGVISLVAINIIISQVEEDVGETAVTIGRLVARTPAVQRAMVSANPSEVLQPLAESWRISSGAAFIVIANMDEIRLTHTIPENVGTPLTKLYRAPVLRGEEYIYIGKGSLSPALRASIPIYSIEGDRQVGFVTVGFSLQSIYKDAVLKFTPILYLFLAALGVGVWGSVIIARHVKNAIFGMEPQEIATLMKERSATLEAIREGLVAVDKNGVIRLLNNEAAHILGVSPDSVYGQHINVILPENKLATVIQNDQAIYDEEQRVGDTVILANSVPIDLDGGVVGAVISFRDRTEIHRLAEELTGVHRFVDVLRAQAHEFKNKLHTIAGLIQLQRYDEAVDFAVESGESKQGLADRLTGRIQDSIIYGLLLGKASHMRELGIDFEVAPESRLVRLPDNITSGDMVLIIGNMLQNAIEAVAKAEVKHIEIGIIQQEDALIIKVRNSGAGINERIAEQIYRRGFTTKQGNGGYGLALIAEKLALVSGSISHLNLPEGGVEFTVRMPY
jgi:PAS domain S-box-containing protein